MARCFYSDRTLLRRCQLVVFLRRRIGCLGEYVIFAGHLFGASDFACAGVQDHVIRMLDRWSSDGYRR